jgi:hypothetical protein
MIKWLLRNNPALLGDLLEERAAGRSRGWFWKQMIVAVGRSIFNEVREHPVLLLRAIATVLVVEFAVVIAASAAFGFFTGLLYPTPLPSAWFPITIFALPSLASGWVMARTHRPCMEAAVIVIVLLGAHLTLVNEIAVASFLVGVLIEVLGKVKANVRST